MDAIRCPRCQRPLPSVANYCGHCGTAVRGRSFKSSCGPKPRRGGLLLALIIAVAVAWGLFRTVDRNLIGPPFTARSAHVNFMGTSTRAQRVAYVCAASSFSRQSMDFFLSEMRRSVARLDSSQWFNVYFLSCPSASLDWGNLVMATPENTSRARSLVPRAGMDEPMIGEHPLLRVIRQRPEVIFLVADSDLSPGNTGIVEMCRREAVGVRINTIALIPRTNRSDPNAQYVRTLQDIAAVTGGTFKRYELPR